MTKLNTVAEMNEYVRKISVGKNPALDQLTNSWRSWYDGLTWYEKYMSTDCKNGHDRLQAIDTLRGGSRIGQETLARATIKKGSTGADVSAWQKIIGVKVTGDFDDATKSATIAWQREKGLDADGIVGPNTWGSVKAEKKGFALPKISRNVKIAAGVTFVGILGGIAAAFLPDKKTT